jgi:5'-nucleotidase
VFTQGRDPFGYLRPLGAQLFLSANAADVTEALRLGYPAARVLTDSAAPAPPIRRRCAF